MHAKSALVCAIVIAFAVSCCTTQKKYAVAGKTPAEKIKQIYADLDEREWDVPMKDMKTKLADQLSRVENGMKNGKITDTEAESIIEAVENVVSSIDKMREEMSSRSGGMGGPPPGGMGGPPPGGMDGGMGEPPSGGMGAPPSGGDNFMGKGNGGSKDFMEPKEYKALKTLIDELYLNTITASTVAEPVTTTPETK